MVSTTGIVGCWLPETVDIGCIAPSSLGIVEAPCALACRNIASTMGSFPSDASADITQDVLSLDLIIAASWVELWTNRNSIDLQGWLVITRVHDAAIARAHIQVASAVNATGVGVLQSESTILAGAENIAGSECPPSWSGISCVDLSVHIRVCRRSWIGIIIVASFFVGTA